jgi:hypothetical protein
MTPAILHSQVLPSNNSPRNDRESRECIVKTPGNTVTMEITIHFNTKQSTDGLNVIIVFVDPHGIVLPFTSVHATYIAEERYNLTARVGEQAVIGEYHLTEMRVASQLAYTKAFHADLQKLEAELHCHRARNSDTFVANPRRGDNSYRAAGVENHFRPIRACADLQKGHEACCADGRRHQDEHFLSTE